jgi:3-oxoacid CoA-transferase A subunit
VVNKVYPTPDDALADVFDGATILIGGFGPAGSPANLIQALRRQGATNLTIVANNCGLGDLIDTLAESGQMRRFIGSFPVRPSASEVTHLERRYRAGEIEVEVVPQGTLAERVRAAGAGIAAFYTPTGVGTRVAEGKELRVFDGKEYLLERALGGDFALIKAYKADTAGNLIYHAAARNFNPTFATAGKVTIAEVEEVVPAGALDPEAIVTPGIFVDRIVVAAKHVAWFTSRG